MPRTGLPVRRRPASSAPTVACPDLSLERRRQRRASSSYYTYFPEHRGASQPGASTAGTSRERRRRSPLLTAIAERVPQGSGQGPASADLNAAIYANGFPRASAFSDVTAHTYGTAPSGVLQDNRMWETGADGFVTPGAVPGFPTTTGYDLTTGWGSPQAARLRRRTHGGTLTHAVSAGPGAA